MSSIHVMTGATSGLGLAAARRLAQKTDSLIIAGARRPENAIELKQAVETTRLEVLQLDTSSLASVQEFIAAVKERIGSRRLSSLTCIAGLQILGPQKMTGEGIDQTFATNVLGHIALVDGLRDSLEANAAVITIGSGTHDPDNRLAARAGFAGADFTDAMGTAMGQGARPDRDERGRALDRYATSKLCAIYHAAATGAEPGFSDYRVYCFDPGLMPGTALARQQNAVVRFVWKRVMPVLRHLVEGVSSPEQSAELLVDDLVLGQRRYAPGAHIEFTGKPAASSRQADDLEAARRFLADARALLSETTSLTM